MHAIAHGQNPLYSTNLFYPGGVNLLSNTSELGIGIILAPVTWAFGPIATLNVALFLAPLASALAMFVLLRRWVRWLPAAFVGGLAYGFSPYLLLNLTGGWLMVSMAFVPPLVLLCLDELLFRQRRRPILVGLALGLLIVVQFFLGTELLFIMAMFVAIGLAVIVIYAARRRPEELRSHSRHAVVGLAAGGVTAVVLLAYPLWFAFAGPAHLSGRIWPSLDLAYGGSNLSNVLFAPSMQLYGFGSAHFNHTVGGYQGVVLSNQFVGIGLFVIVAGGLVVFRRDLKLWFFSIMALVSLVLSLGASTSTWQPWSLLTSLPEFENVIPLRVLDVTWLFLAVVLGIIVDRTYWAVAAWRDERERTARPSEGPVERIARRCSAAAAALVVAVVALIQPALYLAQGIPFTIEPVVIPAWFVEAAPHLDAKDVLLSVPSGNLLESAATWQAVDGFGFSMVGGPGPGAVITACWRRKARCDGDLRFDEENLTTGSRPRRHSSEGCTR